MSQGWSEWREAPAGDFAVLGDPISHSLSAKMHTAGYQAAGLQLTYHAIRVEASEWDEALAHLAGLGYQGVNVTLPHKERAFAWCKEALGLAAIVGAVNTLRLADQSGCNTDGPALVAVAQEMGLQPDDEILVLGAGGTGRTAVVALAEAGFRIRIWNRTRERAKALAELVPREVTVVEEPRLDGVAAVFNTTSATVRGEGLTIPWLSADPTLKLFEAGYGMPSSFLSEGQAQGFETWDGRLMLAEQGALAWEWWLGIPAPRAAMLEAIR